MSIASLLHEDSWMRGTANGETTGIRRDGGARGCDCLFLEPRLRGDFSARSRRAHGSLGAEPLQRLRRQTCVVRPGARTLSRPLNAGANRALGKVTAAEAGH